MVIDDMCAAEQPKPQYGLTMSKPEPHNTLGIVLPKLDSYKESLPEGWHLEERRKYYNDYIG